MGSELTVTNKHAPQAHPFHSSVLSLSQVEGVDMGAPADTAVEVVVGYQVDTAVVEDIRVDSAVDMGLEDPVDSAVEGQEDTAVDMGLEDLVDSAVVDIQEVQVDTAAVEDIQEDQVDTALEVDTLEGQVDTAVEAMV